MIDLSLGSKVIFTNNFEIALQEIDILFNTNYTELIGYPKFGSDFFVFLNSLQLSPRDIEEYIKQLLAQCESLQYVNYDVSVEIEYDEANFDRIIYVKMNVYNDDMDVERKYNLSKLLYIDNV